MAELVRRRWYAFLAPLLAIAAVAAAIAPGAASAAVQTGTIAGTLSDTSGAAVVGAAIDVQDAAGNGVVSGETMAGGAFSIADVPVGTYYIYIYAEGESNSAGVPYANQWYGPTPGAADSLNEANATAVSVTSGGTTTLTSPAPTVIAGGELTGTIKDAATNSEVDDGYVYVDDSSGDEVGDSDVTTSGGYTVTGLPSGTYYLFTTGDDNANNDEWDLVSNGDPVNDADGYYNSSSGLSGSLQTATPVTVTAGGHGSDGQRLTAGGDERQRHGQPVGRPGG